MIRKLYIYGLWCCFWSLLISVPGDAAYLVARPGASAGSQTPLRGEQNISRYLCRVFLPHLYEGRGPVIASQVDNAIDKFALVLSEGSSHSSKEKASSLRNMNSQLGRSDFLVGSSLTLADVLVFYELSSSSSPAVGDNVKKWQKRLSSIPALSVTMRLWGPGDISYSIICTCAWVATTLILDAHWCSFLFLFIFGNHFSAPSLSF